MNYYQLLPHHFTFLDLLSLIFFPRFSFEKCRLSYFEIQMSFYLLWLTLNAYVPLIPKNTFQIIFFLLLLLLKHNHIIYCPEIAKESQRDTLSLFMYKNTLVSQKLIILMVF
jgi:hypothetical protein